MLLEMSCVGFHIIWSLLAGAPHAWCTKIPTKILRTFSTYQFTDLFYCWACSTLSLDINLNSTTINLLEKQHEEYPSCIHRITTSLTQWLLCTSQVFLCKILHLCSTPFFWTVARSLLDAFLFTTSWGEKTWKSPYLVDSGFLEVTKA